MVEEQAEQAAAVGFGAELGAEREVVAVAVHADLAHEGVELARLDREDEAVVVEHRPERRALALEPRLDAREERLARERLARRPAREGGRRGEHCEAERVRHARAACRAATPRCH
jgi:hypothetical protein